MPRLGVTGGPRAAGRRRPVAIRMGAGAEVKMSDRGPSGPREPGGQSTVLRTPGRTFYVRTVVADAPTIVEAKRAWSTTWRDPHINRVHPHHAGHKRRH